MSPLTIILLALALLGGAAYLLWRRYLQRLEKIKFASIASAKNIQNEISVSLKLVYRSLAKREIPDAEEITRLAKEPKTRFKLYETLLAYNVAHLFPIEHLSHQSMAESQFVYRMQHVHRLGQVPDTMEFEEKVTINRGGKDLSYFVFRFKMDPPHPFASKGWHRAICGPYEKHHPAHNLAMNIHFAELNEWESALAHVESAHDNLYQEPSDEVKKILNLV